MNEKQFGLAIKGLRMQAKSRDVAYRILVKGEARKAVMEDVGMEKAAVSKLIARIMNNFREQLANHDLVYEEYVLPKKLKPVIDAVEDEHLNQYVKEARKKKRR